MHKGLESLAHEKLFFIHPLIKSLYKIERIEKKVF